MSHLLVQRDCDSRNEETKVIDDIDRLVENSFGC
jgi:hypothetical protein